jgi:hypothetical protein
MFWPLNSYTGWAAHGCWLPPWMGALVQSSCSFASPLGQPSQAAVGGSQVAAFLG